MWHSERTFRNKDFIIRPISIVWMNIHLDEATVQSRFFSFFILSAKCSLHILHTIFKILTLPITTKQLHSKKLHNFDRTDVVQEMTGLTSHYIMHDICTQEPHSRPQQRLFSVTLIAKYGGTPIYLLKQDVTPFIKFKIMCDVDGIMKNSSQREFLELPQSTS